MEKQWNRILLIVNSLFEVDLGNEKLISIENQGYFIGFERLIRYNNDFFLGYFNIKSKLYLANEVDDPQVVRFLVHAKTLKDIKLSALDIEKINAQSELGGFRTRLFSDRLINRLHGELPIIDIAGNPYIVDWVNRRLVHKHNSKSEIHLADCTPVIATGEYQCYYDLVSRTRVDINPGLQKFSATMVSLIIPCKERLDQVGVALEERKDLMKFLAQWPFERDLMAKVQDVNSTVIPEMVRQRQFHVNPEIKMKINSNRKLRLN